MAFRPDYAVHPGESLAEALQERAMTQGELALRTGLTEKHINQIINGKSPITPDTAIILECILGVGAGFWNNLQKNYDETIARFRAEQTYKEETKILRVFKNCYTELVRYNILEKKTNELDIYKQLAEYFGVGSLLLVEKTESIAYRKVVHTDIDSPTLSGWLRLGTRYMQQMGLKEYSESKLKDALEKIRNAVNMRGDTIKQITSILNNCGVGILLTPYFSKTNVHGATRWVGNNPLIQLSTRGNAYDRLWFTLFHELGHILLHGKKDQFLEYKDENYRNDPKEKEADEFAEEQLIPRAEYKAFVSKGDFSPNAISIFAEKVKIEYSVAAGRLAKDKYISRAVANKYKRDILIRR